MKRLLGRCYRWIDERVGITDTIVPIITHVVPRDAKWWYVFGSAAFCAFMMQVVTGVALAFSYVPSGGEAFASLTYITDHAFFGRLLRGMHYWGASAMVVMVFIHLAQVFLHGSYKFPREMNWLSGVALLLLTLSMAFTGQLLRWDANAVWSVVVGAEQADRAPVIGPALARFILGGETIGGATLSRFFALHVFIFPAIIFGAVGLHLWLVLRHGVSEMPKAGQPVEPATYKEGYEKRLKKSGVPFFPHAAWRDVVFMTLMVVGIVLCASIFGPPALDRPPDPADMNVNPAPDWYLMWYFAVLALLPPSIETWVILGAPLLAFGILFVIPLVAPRGERAPSRRPWAVAAVVAAALGFVVLTILGFQAPWSPDFGVQPLPPTLIASAAASVPESSRATVERGAALVHSKGCLYCHDIDGHGGHRGPELTQIGRLLDRDQLVIRINNGGHNMPAFASSLTSEELEAIVAFLGTRGR